jgi:hypothetical protein
MDLVAVKTWRESRELLPHPVRLCAGSVRNCCQRFVHLDDRPQKTGLIHVSPSHDVKLLERPLLSLSALVEAHSTVQAHSPLRKTTEH